MSNISKIHSGKTPHRLHFIPEWAEKRNLRQVDIVREVGADKGLVSKWFKGVLPNPEYLESLAALFSTDVSGLFRHPDDDWLSRFFLDKTEEQKEKAISMLKIMFDDQEKQNKSKF
ncbi:helix-turn-helix domain-containing protein [Agrobacterium vitis]|uniref:helix-turn-helix domain-containing protein n=1 Tax=Agrobacterium vitis TaxID=373 RepID=UPI003D28E09D